MFVSVFKKTSYLKAADGYVYKFTSMFDMKLCNFESEITFEIIER